MINSIPFQLLKNDFKKLPRLGQRLLMFSCVLSTLLYCYLMYLLWWKNLLVDREMLQVDTCPLCFGQSLCQQLMAGKADFKGLSRLKLVNSLANVKNVFYGYYEDHHVVFKKLAHTSELLKFDEESKTAIMLNSTFKGKLKTQDVTGLSDLTHCPSQRLLDRMVLNYVENLDVTLQLSQQVTLYLMTTLKINPEPLVLQTFPKDGGYPFPTYYGACGRYVIEEYIGPSLRDVYDSSWYDRANYAHQLIKMADMFQNTSDHYAIYMLDTSIDNFAVSSEGKVYHIDTENILVVDLQQLTKDNPINYYHEPLLVTKDLCEADHHSMTIPTDDLCTHTSSDFNYYAICFDILTGCSFVPGLDGGLLHDVPTHIDKVYKITELLKECLSPPPGSDRFKVKDKLANMLVEIMKKESVWEPDML